MLIAIEGTDGCGKATQTELLNNYLVEKGENCVKISFPNYDSDACGAVKMYLNGDLGGVNNLDAYQVNSFYAVDRVCTMQKYIEHIKNGGSIVFDRYVQSTMLYQSALLPNKHEVDKFLKYVENFEFKILKLPRPDVVIFLDMPVEFSKKLADIRENYKSNTQNDIYESNVNHLKKSYEIGKYVAKKQKWLVINCIKDGKIKSIDEIHKEILTILGV